MSDAIAFIDDDFDPQHKLMVNDFYYVKEKDELISKIHTLKTSPSLINNLKQYQYARVWNLFNKKEYMEMVRKLIYENQN